MAVLYRYFVLESRKGEPIGKERPIREGIYRKCGSICGYRKLPAV